MEIKRKNLQAAHRVLKSLFNQKCDPKTAYSVFVNLKLVEQEIKSFEEFTQTQIPEDFKKYEEERIKLCQDFSGGKLDGNSNFVIPEDKQEEFTSEFEKLRKKHENALKQFAEAQENVNKLLDENVEIELKKFKADRVPSISGMEIAILDEAGLLWED